MKANFTLLIIAVFFFSSCEKEPEQAAYPYYQVLKESVQTNVSTFNTGLYSLGDTWLVDSIEKVKFCKAFAHAAFFLDEPQSYLFVESLNGYNIAHPAQPELEGQSSLEQTDAHGNLIVLKMIDLVTYQNGGFLSYDYSDLNGNIDEKTTYVKAIPGTDWYAGSGFYGRMNEPYLCDFKKNEKVVQEAVNFMARGLAAVLPTTASDSLERVELMRTFLRHIRFFDNLSGYFFVLDYRGYNVVQPPEPEREGNYQWDMQDSRGNYLMQGLIETAQNGGGFYSYYWMDYQTNTEQFKNAYVTPIPGYDYLIGSGVYYPEF